MGKFTGMYDKNNEPINVGDLLTVVVGRNNYNPQSYHDRKKYTLTMRVVETQYPTLADIEQGAKMPSYPYAHFRLDVADKAELEELEKPRGQEKYKRSINYPYNLAEAAYNFRLGQWAYDNRPVKLSA